jgi:class 3 adenylate cyclase
LSRGPWGPPGDTGLSISRDEDELSLSVGFGPGRAARAWHRKAVVPVAARPADTPVPGAVAGGGALRPVSLRFADAGLERDYQRQGGIESLAGYRFTTGAAAALWLLAAIVLPLGTPISLDEAVPICAAMVLMNWSAFLFSENTDTLDAQHFVISVLTSVNGLVILGLAATGGVLPGYGVAAITLMFAFGFVTRTGFMFATLRSGVIVAGFAAALVLYRGRGNLEVDAFIFAAAVTVTLLALRRLEQSRRRVFYQDVVITQQADALQVEKGRADDLLLNMLPGPISTRLLAGERTIADGYPSVTVLFGDIVGFTSLASRLPAEDVVLGLDRLFAHFDELTAERGLEKIKTIGDAYMVAGGLTESLPDDAARVVDLGLAMIEVAARECDQLGGLQLRVGVHSGPVIGGVIGHHKFAFDIWGETVNIASRLESHGIPGSVQVSAETRRLVGDTFEVKPRGPIRVRGYGLLETHLIVGRLLAS